MHRNMNPCNSFLMVKMASSMDHGRVRPTTTTTNDNDDDERRRQRQRRWRTTTTTTTRTNDDDDEGRRTTWPSSSYSNTKSCSLGLHHISLILDMHIMCNWQLSYQEIRWPVSHDHIAGSGLEPSKVACFFEVDRWPSAGFRSDRRLMSA